MSDPFVAEIRMFSGNFAPTGWAMCNGQLMPIRQNTALFSLLGTHFGGDGINTFGLPDLRARAPLGAGYGPGLSGRDLGESGGVSQVTLQEANIPAHSHALQASQLPATSTAANGGTLAKVTSPTPPYHAVAGGPNANAHIPGGVGVSTGGNAPHNNEQPYLEVSFIIALQGIFPSRW
ncbi:phage tail protein [Oxalobacteraceae bacterium]|nr:phage tail protein [Oxalobacteraceae bacterium]